MKRLVTLFFAFTIAFLISSCSTTLNQKKIIGTWKAVKIERYNIPNLAAQPAGGAANAKATASENADSTGTPKQLSKEEEQLRRMIKAEQRSTLTINPDKTAIKEIPGKTIHVTWKLKKQGTRLVINNKENGKKSTIEILAINDTSAVVVETLPIGGLKVTLKKEKK
jgi:hypothetical protein